MTPPNAEERAFLRLRASQGDSLCPDEHVVHRDGDGLYITCGDVQLGRLDLTDDGKDHVCEIRCFMVETIANHDRRVAGNVVMLLLKDDTTGERAWDSSPPG